MIRRLTLGYTWTGANEGHTIHRFDAMIHRPVEFSGNLVTRLVANIINYELLTTDSVTDTESEVREYSMQM